MSKKPRADEQNSRTTRERAPESIVAVLAEIFRDGSGGGNAAPSSNVGTDSCGNEEAKPLDETAGARYDFDLAEFPLFRFHKNTLAKHDRKPLIYSDTIRGRDGEAVTRDWKAYPGPFGFGGPSAQILLYDLLQLYADQGSRGSQLQFGTIRSLLLRRGERNPSSRDYERVRRDIEVLRGYDFHCKNAFWDSGRRAYADMNWRLFGSVFYFKETSSSGREELPFGFIEVSPVLQAIARTRGFFHLGFGSESFYQLRPLEQRLAVYLAKKFTSQKVHRRFVDDLASALPIEASRPRDVRAILKDAANGLLEKHLPILRSFEIDGSNDGRYVAKFIRGKVPTVATRSHRDIPTGGDPEFEYLIERMIAETGSRGDAVWWRQCLRRLGRGPVERALGQLQEAAASRSIRNRGALLTKILKDIATESGIAIRGDAPR